MAVLAVIMFHAAPAAAPGGFVGVDIFFVISGFLITRIISQEIDSGSYSTLRFYERRLRRIAPAFLVVCAFSTVAAALLYIPDHFELFGESLIASILIHANIFFYHEAGYFAAPDEVMPLLHIWSLSVEEQFYVAFPIALVLLTRRRNLRTAGIVTGIALSFGAACVLVLHNPAAAFYLAPLRAWELLIGSLLAVGALPAVRGRAADACSSLGGALIAAGIWGLSSNSTFPGLTALLPCLGAALIIHAGSRTPLNRGLSFQPVVGVGLISYSLYLWHWPLLSFGAYVAMRPLSAVETALIVLISFLAAWISYRYVEQPFRRPARRLGLSPLITGAAALLAVAAIADLTKGAAWRLPATVVAIAEDQSLPMQAERCEAGKLADAHSSMFQLSKSAGMHICRVGEPSADPKVLLWGDSHAMAVAPAFDSALKKHGMSGYILGQHHCPPLANLERLDANTSCSIAADTALQIISSFQPSGIILAARWAHYVEGTRYGQEKRAPALFAPEGNFEVVSLAFDETLERLPGQTPVIIMESVPEIGVHVPSMLARAALFERQADIAPTRQQYAARQKRTSSLVSHLAAKYGSSTLHPADYLCNGLTCLVEMDGRALYVDGHHLSQAGAALLVPMFSSVVQAWAGAAPTYNAAEAAKN